MRTKKVREVVPGECTGCIYAPDDGCPPIRSEGVCAEIYIEDTPEAYAAYVARRMGVMNDED